MTEGCCLCMRYWSCNRWLDQLRRLILYVHASRFPNTCWIFHCAAAPYCISTFDNGSYRELPVWLSIAVFVRVADITADDQIDWVACFHACMRLVTYYIFYCAAAHHCVSKLDSNSCYRVPFWLDNVVSVHITGSAELNQANWAACIRAWMRLYLSMSRSALCWHKYYNACV